MRAKAATASVPNLCLLAPRLLACFASLTSQSKVFVSSPQAPPAPCWQVLRSLCFADDDDIINGYAPQALYHAYAAGGAGAGAVASAAAAAGGGVSHRHDEAAQWGGAGQAGFDAAAEWGVSANGSYDSAASATQWGGRDQASFDSAAQWGGGGEASYDESFAASAASSGDGWRPPPFDPDALADAIAAASGVARGPAPPPAKDTVAARFAVPARLKFGEHVAVVGDAPELGAWLPFAGLHLSWTEGDVWAGDAEIPASRGSVEFKFIVVGEKGEQEWWEPGDNRSAPLPEAGWGMVYTAHAWGDAGHTLLTVEPPAPDAPEAGASEAYARARAEADYARQLALAVSAGARGRGAPGGVGDTVAQGPPPASARDLAALQDETRRLRSDAAAIVSELAALREAMARRLAALRDGQKLLARLAATQIISSVPGPAGAAVRGRRRAARAVRLSSVAGRGAARLIGAGGGSESDEEVWGQLAELEGAAGGGAVVVASADGGAAPTAGGSWRRQWRARRALRRPQ